MHIKDKHSTHLCSLKCVELTSDKFDHGIKLSIGLNLPLLKSTLGKSLLDFSESSSDSLCPHNHIDSEHGLGSVVEEPFVTCGNVLRILLYSDSSGII